MFLYLNHFLVIFLTGELLLGLGHFHKAIASYQLGQLAHKCDVFGYSARHFFELWIVLNKRL